MAGISNLTHQFNQPGEIPNIWDTSSLYQLNSGYPAQSCGLEIRAVPFLHHLIYGPVLRIHSGLLRARIFQVGWGHADAGSRAAAHPRHARWRPGRAGGCRQRAASPVAFKEARRRADSPRRALRMSIEVGFPHRWCIFAHRRGLSHLGN